MLQVVPLSDVLALLRKPEFSPPTPTATAMTTARISPAVILLVLATLFFVARFVMSVFAELVLDAKSAAPSPPVPGRTKFREAAAAPAPAPAPAAGFAIPEGQLPEAWFSRFFIPEELRFRERLLRHLQPFDATGVVA